MAVVVELLLADDSFRDGQWSAEERPNKVELVPPSPLPFAATTAFELGPGHRAVNARSAPPELGSGSDDPESGTSR